MHLLNFFFILTINILVSCRYYIYNIHTHIHTYIYVCVCVFVLGILSDETWKNIETELINFKSLSAIPTAITNNESNVIQIGHSLSDLFLHKQSVSDKVVADCIESLIGIYVYVSIINVFIN